MYIAPGFSDADWQSLKLNDPASPDWNIAIQILQGRIHERFIEPIDFLIASEQGKPPSDRRFGFAILAIDCLLVETLGAFIDGLEDTEGQSKATFCRFLTTRPAFASEFVSQDLARQFYREFRCGILHQAEVGGGSKVWSIGPLLRIDGVKITVNRNEFHERLKVEFQGYLVELRDPAKTTLRQHFRKKMDLISRSYATA